MLDAHAHGERLLLHAHARVAHELERVAGRMTARQHHAACGNQLGDGFGFGGFGLCRPQTEGFPTGQSQTEGFRLGRSRVLQTPAEGLLPEQLLPAGPQLGRIPDS